jgi:hypothetical protein
MCLISRFRDFRKEAAISGVIGKQGVSVFKGRELLPKISILER